MMRPEQESKAPTHDMEIHPVRAVLWETLMATDVEKEYVPDRTRQQRVFDHIRWDTFLDEVKKESGGTGEGAGPDSIGAGKRLRGKVFEMLIQADPSFGQRSALEQELLALAHAPDQFGLGKLLGYHRNPDMAFLIVQNENGVEITGVGESKLGLLNERSFKQLSETGFARGVKALVEVVNTLPDPQAHGLVEVAKAREALAPGKPLLTVSPEFTQLLVVPANRNIEWSSSLINRREFTMEGRQKFYELLTDMQKVRTANAAFSTREVSAIAGAMAPYIAPM